MSCIMVLEAVKIKGLAFWDAMTCNSERARRFGEIYRLHLQGQRWVFSLSPSSAGIL
jgi:hypothetical protein